MMCDARLFAPQIAALSAGRTVQVPALTGAETMEALAEQVLSQAPPRFALAGLSMGGILAMEMLRQAPERIERVAFLDTNPRAELPEVQAGRAPQVARVREEGLGSVLRREVFPHYLHPESDPAILDLCEEMALALGPDIFERQSLALRDRADAQEVLAAVRQPTLILTGEDDRLCPMDRHTRMAALMPHARLVVVPRAGHLPTLEQPAAVNAALNEWLT
ncbi:alpha/beta fold hydrolase [Pseudoroseicyclus sp. CLL3-39]|uniref:Alpha/beta fold hydrolase n=2 Tax=Pseudoroseicyclus tamaricis TaxID=2705421 RepID=A0A6B2JY60_9RHOB|nr:alpha/beta fold hydrolase [Pseudoroseicyclus tamaricis]